ncbi:MAG: FAD-dependent oxidoreductase, partial [Nonomuraea muscovyensis]|nr:FAD-dependent oxidoreductase [Nonomuraea muscovyensis]
MVAVPNRFPVVVVGAGQAGLAVSYELTARGIEHLVLERARVGQSWRGLWDSFWLVTPNWTMSLPGAPYTGDDPEGFVPRDEIVRYLQRYASSFAAPVREGVGVDRLEPGPGGGFLLGTSAGELRAASVVVCTGAYQRPHRPAIAAGFPREVLVLDAHDYRNPTALPPGKVLVVGSGQTGCQLAEELRQAGREVFLACGRAPWLPRRPGGRDIVTWLKETSFFDTPLSALPAPAARLGANLLVTGHRGGHDLHYRTLQATGVQLLGRLAGVAGHRAAFAGDLADSVAFGDARHADIRTLLGEQLPPRASRRPSCPTPRPFTPTRRWSWTSTGSGWRSSPPGSAPTMGTGCGSPPSTPWASHAPTTGPARRSRACPSAASTSSASASPRSCSAWARTPPSS